MPSHTRSTIRLTAELLEDRTAPANLFVTNTNDAGPGSLRQAVLDANNEAANPGPDTITFGGTAFAGTINLTSRGGTSYGPNALEVSSDIAIQGSGETIRGLAVFMRLFYVAPGASLALSHVTLTGGTVRGGFGGVSASPGSGAGGGGGAGLGGAIYNQGTLTITHSTLTGNVAEGGRGGGSVQLRSSSAGTGGGGLGGFGGGFAGGGSGFFGSGAAGGSGVGGGGGGTVTSASGSIAGTLNGGTGGSTTSAPTAGGFGGGGGGGPSGAAGGVGGGGGGAFAATGTGGQGGFGGGGGGGGSEGAGGNGGFGGGGGGSSNRGQNPGPAPGLPGFGGGPGGPLVGSAFIDGGGGGGAGMGGAIFNDQGTVTIVNSTLSANRAVGGEGGSSANSAGGGDDGNIRRGQGLGGAIFSLSLTGQMRLTILNSTITENVAAEGGRGVYLKYPTNAAQFLQVRIDNTIIGQSDTAVTDFAAVRDGTAAGSSNVVGTNNLIRSAGSFGLLGLTATVTGDPRLGPLQSNGGLTFTHLPGAGSSALNAGSNGPATGLTTDQRGLDRVSGGLIDIGAVEVEVPPLPPTGLAGTLAVSGPANGTASVFTAGTGGQYVTTPVASLFPFGTVLASVRTAQADVNGDRTPDTVLVTGSGAPIRVAVISGTDNSTVLVSPFDPFGGNFTGGGFVAAANLDGDGRAEFIVTPDQGGGPRVTILSLNADGTMTVRANFLGIDDPNFRGGARAALGDVNRDGTPDLAVSAGFLGGPRTALFDGTTLFATPTPLVGDFFAFPGTDATTLRNGVFVAAGDVNGDGFADLIFGGGPGGAPRVFILSGALIAANDVAGAQAAPVANFFVAGNTTDRGGARVATKDADGDTRADVVVGSGEGSLANVRVYLGVNFTGGGEPGAFQDLDPFGGATLPGGVFVG